MIPVVRKVARNTNLSVIERIIFRTDTLFGVVVIDIGQFAKTFIRDTNSRVDVEFCISRAANTFIVFKKRSA